jgi:NMD protein affecting ribosome stability and mRNA decay
MRADKDMTFNPAYNMWFCVDCYAKTGEFYKQVLQERAEKGVSREDYDDFDEDYFKSFT